MGAAIEELKFAVSIAISDDYYQATMNLRFMDATLLLKDLDESQRQGLRDRMHAEIKERLSRLNITFGLLTEIIDHYVDACEGAEGVVIAKGIPHVHGTDALMTYHVNFEGKSKPIILEDGSVDFKNLLQASAVKAQMVLATKTPVVPGMDGTTVTGKQIKHRPGKDIQWKYGENVGLTSDGLQLYAEADGIAKLINGRITVLRVFEVTEVGPESGNIYFGGDVHVKENVLDGYTIHCDGDLTIDGVVEGCMIKTKGNLTVGKGILGHGVSDIVVGGNLVTKFIENANVYVKGEIETGEIINSTVLCDNKISVKGKKGLIIGGEITSKYMIEANHIGSRLGVLTSINLGVDASVIQELKQLKETVQELKILESRLLAKIPALKENAIKQPEVGVHGDILKQYEDSLRSTQMDLEEKQNRLSQLMEALQKVNQGKVKINSIFPDTVVRIGNSKYFVDKALSACIITRADDQVIAIGIQEEKK